MSAAPSPTMLTKDAKDGLRFPVLESGSPFPKDTTSKSSMPTEKDHLLRICQNERILLPSIEPKIIPEDVCVAEELDPEEHPEVFWMEEIRKYKEKGDLPDNPAEAAKKASGKEEMVDQPRKQLREQKGKLYLESQGKPEEYLPKSRQLGTPSRIPHSRSHNLGSEEILSSPQGVVGVSLPSPRLKGWGEGLQKYPPLRGHYGPASSGGAFPGEPVRLNEESAVKEDQRYLSSSS
nr:uncharacterized protein LOC109162254 [Ipomoea batatas]